MKQESLWLKVEQRSEMCWVPTSSRILAPVIKFDKIQLLKRSSQKTRTKPALHRLLPKNVEILFEVKERRVGFPLSANTKYESWAKNDG